MVIKNRSVPRSSKAVVQVRLIQAKARRRANQQPKRAIGGLGQEWRQTRSGSVVYRGALAVRCGEIAPRRGGPVHGPAASLEPEAMVEIAAKSFQPGESESG